MVNPQTKDSEATVQGDQYGIIAPSLAIDSMRRNGYLTTDMAIAELIDNSVDAKATRIELLLFEEEVELEKVVSRVARIGVLDNGHAMTSHELRHGLRFGGGSTDDPNAIGRFGFGLPNSSISQANRLEVWTWQNGPDNALWSYLDVGEVRRGTYVDVPKPEIIPLPAEVRRLSNGIGRTGTYVQWSELDEDITWKRGKTVLKHTSLIVGRIYRRFLQREANRVHIRMAVVGADGRINEGQDKVVPVTDPLYLMEGTSCPWAEEPMFQLHTQHDWTFQDRDGADQTVTVTISYAKPECRRTVAGIAAGSQEHGAHAKRNLGVSIVRADRELQLENVLHAEPYLDRWWGVEIAFPPQLDSLFGVSNNKQGANLLIAALRTFDADEKLTVRELIDSGDLDRDEDRVELYRLAQWVNEQVRSVMRLIRKQNVGERGDEDSKRHDEPTVEDRATQAIKRRAGRQPTEEEEIERERPTPRKEQIRAGQEALEEAGYSEQDARAIMEVALDRDRKILFVEAHPDTGGDAIFDVRQLPGSRVELLFNVNHPAHAQIFETLEAEVGSLSPDEMRNRLMQASDALKLLFAAWTRMELEARKGPERSAYQRIRRDWGRMAADFLEPDFAGALEELASE